MRVNGDWLSRSRKHQRSDLKFMKFTKTTFRCNTYEAHHKNMIEGLCTVRCTLGKFEIIMKVDVQRIYFRGMTINAWNFSKK